ncbi:MAG: SpoIVB peptidase [Negativibacillus sp.]|nr:SpoIVB peptidase [Clostridium sp.]MEE0783921.1 SpoIVB peptidase [Negativibacillus sp.]
MKQKKTFHLSLRRTWQLMTGGLSVVTLAALCWALCLSATLPDRYYLAKGSRFSLGDSSLIQTSSNDGYPLSVYSSTGNTFRMDLKLLGLINIKPVSVQVVDRRVVALCGTPFGIKMVTDGVMVVGTGAVTDCNSRAVSPAQTAGIQEGDIILSINGEKISSKKQLTKLVESSAGQPLSLVVRRGEQLTSLHLSPVRSSLDNSYHLGLWVRDSSAGIGTMTFYDPNNGCFAGLGHAICDVDTGQLMPLSQGEIVEASIIGVHAGKSGSPGQLQGAFVANRSIGSLYTNSYNGVYGRLMNQPVDAQTIPMAQCQEVRQGPVKILTTVSGQKPQLFDACIEKLSLSQDEPTKNMVLRITDPDLLELSGGIVQGMSGSPIIQDGMLVGAVTHVFVNDPTRGYGIFAENMDNTLLTVAAASQSRAAAPAA